MPTEPLPSPPLTLETMTAMVQIMELRIAELEEHLAQDAQEKRSWEKDKQLLQQVSNTIEEMIAIVDCHGRRIWNNRAFSKGLGYPPDQSPGDDLEIHRDDQMKFQRAFADALQNGYSKDIKYRIRNANGEWLTWSSRSRAVYDEQKRVEYVILVAQDLATVRQQGTSSLSAVQSSGLSQLANHFAEIITTAQRHIATVRHGLESTSPAAGEIARAEHALLNASDLIQQLTALAKQKPSKLSTTPVKRLLQTVSTKTIRNPAARLEFFLPDQLPPAVADSESLKVVFTEILANADHAMKSPGIIRISGELLTLTPGAEQAALGVEPGRYVRIQIMDQGQGIPPNKLEQVFDPYFTTKPGALGMGLTTALSIVKRHGGNLLLTSTENVGTTATVLLPVNTSPPAQASATTLLTTTQPLRLNTKKSGTILLMDHEPIVCDFAARIFEELGFKPTLASNGTVAVQACSKAKSKGIPFDFVFLDLDFKNGISGAETYRILRKFNPHLKVVLVAKTLDRSLLNNPDFSEIYTFMRKPYTKETVQKILSS